MQLGVRFVTQRYLSDKMYSFFQILTFICLYFVVKIGKMVMFTKKMT